MRPFWTVVHRWLGLITAAFLFVTGLTGTVISWDHELDDLLNPQLTQARAHGLSIPAVELARQVEARHPEIRVTYLPLAAAPGESLEMAVEPRVNPATGTPFQPGYNDIFVDPVSGEELGKREWGAVWPITRETFISFLYKLHYSLHIPAMWGIDRWGEWLLGAIALLWTFDCFVGFYLTLPARRVRRPAPHPAPARSFWQRWMPAWRIRWSGGPTKLNFDLHRAFSLWTWGLLFILAFTAFSLNLYREIFFPAMSMVSKVTPTPFDQRKPAAADRPIDPRIGFASVIERAQEDARQRGWRLPVGAVSYAPQYGIFQAFLFRPGESQGADGVGTPRLYYDGQDGHLLGDHQPWTGSAADIFIQAQFPLHSGRILGLPGRILISAMGLVVAMLSVTGVIIWWRKRKARQHACALSQRQTANRNNGSTQLPQSITRTDIHEIHVQRRQIK